MKVISSKNTWYLLFGIIFIVIVTSIAFRLIFKRTEEKLVGSKTNTTQTQTAKKLSLIGQTSTKSNLTYVKASPSPAASFKPSPTPSPTPSPILVDITVTETTSSPTPASQATTTMTTKGGLQVVTDKNGATYLSTKNADDSTDSAKTKLAGFNTKIVPPKGYATDVGLYINQLLRVVLMISALLVFAQLIWGGLEWITSGGDKKKVEDARNKITAAVIGLVIVASSYAILQLALNFIGFESLNEVLKML